MKKCSACNSDKESSQFSKCTSSKDGLGTWCKDCRRSYNGRTSDRRRNERLLREYQITTEDYLSMVGKQQSRCAICRVYSSKLNVDHDHSTGEVRGLLCSPCNTAIGLFKENPKTLRAACAYLTDL